MLQEYTKQTLINDKVKIEEVFVGQEISPPAGASVSLVPITIKYEQKI